MISHIKGVLENDPEDPSFQNGIISDVLKVCTYNNKLERITDDANAGIKIIWIISRIP